MWSLLRCVDRLAVSMKIDVLWYHMCMGGIIRNRSGIEVEWRSQYTSGRMMSWWSVASDVGSMVSLLRSIDGRQGLRLYAGDTAVIVVGVDRNIRCVCVLGLVHGQ